MSFLDKFFYMIGRSMRPMVQQKFDEHDPEKAEWYSKRVKELEEQEKIVLIGGRKLRLI